MRILVVTAALLAALPALAQANGGVWYLDVHRVAPTLEGHYKGTQNGNAVDFDLVNDLGLAKDSTQAGVALEYQGPRFGLELSAESQNYVGSSVLNRQVTISGQTYDAEAQVNSTIKVTNYTFNWTIRFIRTPGAWLGLDLGVLGTALDLNATGYNYLGATPAMAHFKSGLPMPQVGPSVGFTSLGGRFALRGYYHFLDYKGATYHHAGGDLRYFPLNWLGVRAFVSTESWKVPANSVAKDLDIGLDRSGTGFGVVLRF